MPPFVTEYYKKREFSEKGNIPDRMQLKKSCLAAG
jgi:hypothetical protein